MSGFPCLFPRSRIVILITLVPVCSLALVPLPLATPLLFDSPCAHYHFETTALLLAPNSFRSCIFSGEYLEPVLLVRMMMILDILCHRAVINYRLLI